MYVNWCSRWVHLGALSSLGRGIHLVLVNCACLNIGWGSFESPRARCSACFSELTCLGAVLVHLLVKCAYLDNGLGSFEFP